MSLQVNDSRSRTRSKSPGRRERSRSRDSRLASDLNLSVDTSRPRSRSPAIEKSSSSRNYDLDEAEIDRQYKLMKESQERVLGRERDASRAPRSPARYEHDIRRDDSDDSARRHERRRREEKEKEKQEQEKKRDRYEHSDDDRDMRVVQPREYARSPHPSPPLPSRNGHGRTRNRRDEESASESSDDSIDEHLAYGDVPGSHPSYAQPGRFRYAEQTGMFSAPPLPQRPSTKTDWAAVPECERPGFVPPTSQAGMPGAFPSSGYDVPSTMAPSFPAPQYGSSSQPQGYESTGAFTPSHYRTASASDVGHPQGYAQPTPYQYAQVDPNVRYTSKAAPAPKPMYTASSEAQFPTMAAAGYPRGPQPPVAPAQPNQPIYSYKYPSHEPQISDKQPPPPSPRAAPQKQFMEITPGGGRTRPHSLSVSSANNLAVAGAAMAGHHPPASPLLEPYRGTYQSMSPMPSPIVIPSVRDDDISDLEPLDDETSSSETRRRRKHTRTKSSTSEKEREYEREGGYRSSKEKIRESDRKDEKEKDKRRSRPTTNDHDSLTAGDSSLIIRSPSSAGRKRVSFYDASTDAEAMQSALNHTRNIDSKIIIQTLPRLTGDEILLLRQEYKTRVKVHGKGINLAKHLRLKLGTSSFGKVAYATALGRWESEAYWANCYYQAGTSRRELLIESLMGRSNAAIREIKACFRDTRYENSLERCMRSELKADKFRVAVLLALEERRQDDREPRDIGLVRQDVSDLHHALVSRDGGETAMIQIIVLRRDSHLREVLHAYEAIYGQNFARAMISKSRNLVGETLAHILNGAINRPMRDALLLHQALRESKSGRERSELLISRLVRLHWEPRHFEQVKLEYRRRYGERIEEAIAEEILTSSNGGEWGEFCIELVHSSVA
ncbi:hypothetical protein N7490_011695 [Penicillium lividum]|nr:hypothetical protein N7490_011695 [Penicillium lividum]